MEHRSRRGTGLFALTSAAVIGLSLVGAGTAVAGGGHAGGGSPPGTTTVIATGLDNPRQLSFTPTGDLLVAEAGRGGAGPCRPSPEGGNECFGASGAVTKINSQGAQSRIITGLPSFGGENTGASAIGPSDVLAVGRNISVLIGLGADPASRATLPAPGQQMGTLIQTTKDNGTYRTIADIAGWEAANNPIDNPDSDPVGMLYNCGNYVVADAGGNTLLNADLRGRVTELAQFPDNMITPSPVPGGPDPFPQQAVPTSVATIGNDNAYYVSQLTGFPFGQGAASIFRVDHRGNVTTYATGLTNVTDLAFNGRDLYAVQISTTGLQTGSVQGSVVKVKRNGTAPTDHTVVAGDLFAPYGIAIRNNRAYVTTGAVAPGAGQVIKIQL